MKTSSEFKTHKAESFLKIFILVVFLLTLWTALVVNFTYKNVSPEIIEIVKEVEIVREIEVPVEIVVESEVVKTIESPCRNEEKLRDVVSIDTGLIQSFDELKKSVRMVANSMEGTDADTLHYLLDNTELHTGEFMGIRQSRINEIK